MNAPARAEGVQRWLLWTALAIMISGLIFWLWPRLDAPRLGREEVWFALAWLLLLAGPATAELWWPPRPEAELDQDQHTFQAQACGQGAFLLAGLFFALLLAGRELGNYKLWLGVVYLGAVTLRLAGLTLHLLDSLGSRPEADLRTVLHAAGISALACLLILPWVRPDLCSVWPPSPRLLVSPLTACLLWGAIAGAVPLCLRLWGAGRRAAWLAYLAVGLGPGPALAVSAQPLTQLGLGFLALAGLILVRLFSRRPAAPLAAEPQAIPLYWLLRALLLLWWGVGASLTLAAAWWEPRVEALIVDNLWLRAVALGGFLVACLGLLAEYTLPLLGRTGPVTATGERKVLGLIMTALAVLASLSPLVLIQPPPSPAPPALLTERSRAELLAAPLSLSPQNPEITLRTPSWMTGVRRIFVVSLLTNGAEVNQGEAVAQLIATDDQDIPHIYNLRAGVDTAEWALDKRDVAATARHSAARPASSWVVYSPAGEAFEARSYFTGLFLGTEVPRLKSVSLRYLYHNPPGKPPVTVDLKRVFLN